MSAAPPSAPSSAPPRPDALTALLRPIWDEALDPAYAAAADRERRSGQVASRRRRVLRAGMALAVAGLVLAAAAAQTAGARPAAQQQRAELVDRVRQQTTRYDALQGQAASVQAEIDRAKDVSLGVSAEADRLRAQLAALALAGGATAVTGPGLVVTLSDPDPASTSGTGGTGDPSLDRVLDRDLQMVVNGLWAAGAEAVGINGQRLTSTSAIRSAGDAILVDYRPLVPPYVVSAVGPPSRLEADFAAGPGGRGVRTLQEAYGVVVATRSSSEVRLPAASTTVLRYARPQGAP